MATVDLQAVISLPHELVFAALSDLTRRPALDPTITEMTPEPGQLQLGSAFSGRSTLTGAECGIDGVVTAIEPNRLLALGFTTASGARLVEEWRLRTVPSGTLVLYHTELRLPGGIFGKLLDRLIVRGGFQKQRSMVLSSLKAALDQAPMSQ